MDQPSVGRTVRWRRRQVRKVRVTWIGQVGLLLFLLSNYLMQQFPMGMGYKVLLTLGMVVLPVLALALWRAGLLPPERVVEDGPRP